MQSSTQFQPINIYNKIVSILANLTISFLFDMFGVQHHILKPEQKNSKGDNYTHSFLDLFNRDRALDLWSFIGNNILPENKGFN